MSADSISSNDVIDSSDATVLTTPTSPTISGLGRWRIEEDADGETSVLLLSFPDATGAYGTQFELRYCYDVWNGYELKAMTDEQDVVFTPTR